jgi:ribosomal protein L11 methyltransferase
VLELFPAGFEECDRGQVVELAAYGDEAAEDRMRDVFDVVTAHDVEEGWEERWREFHHGVRAGPTWVGPPWEEPPAGLVAVVIDPGRAFGTGAHPTTRLCLEAIAGLARGSLLDAGCGSGVLAVAAAKLGFAPVLAVDIDAEAVSTTLRNAEVNGVEMEARVADVFAGPLPKADVTAANISLSAVEELCRAARSSFLVTSGYLATDELAPTGPRHLLRRELEGWAADVWAVAASGVR